VYWDIDYASQRIKLSDQQLASYSKEGGLGLYLPSHSCLARHCSHGLIGQAASTYVREELFRAWVENNLNLELMRICLLYRVLLDVAGGDHTHVVRYAST